MSESKESEAKQQEVRSKIIKSLDTSKFIHHKLATADALKKLGTNIKTGLTESQVKELTAIHGPNELDEEEGESLWEKIVEQFKDLLVQILLGAAIVSFIFACLSDEDEGLAGFVEPFVILLILALNAIVAVYQDSNADNALEALKKMQAISCKCLRNGEWNAIDAKDLVPGDVVEVKTGDCVPADLRVIEIRSISLMAGQAALTGESVSVQKTTKQLGEDAMMIQDQKNMLFASTLITSGNCIGVVAYTGMNTAIGTIHNQVQQAKEEEEDTPLKQKLDQFGDYLARVIFVVCFLVWAMNFNKFFDPMHGSAVKGCIYYFKIAVALAVAAIPEGLPAVITTCLALGTRKMAKNNCIVRRLPSVETLGCTSVICSDKTGTLTKNQMCAIKFGVIGANSNQVDEFDIEETSYSPESNIVGLSKDQWSKNENFKHMVALATLNNRAAISYNTEMKDWECFGEPTEAAIKVFAEKLNKINSAAYDMKASPKKSEDDLRKSVQEIAVLDFSSERKTMSTVVKGYQGAQNNTVLLKGAPERVLEKCNSFMTASGKNVSVSAKEKDAMATKIKDVASLGYRVLGFAIGLDGGSMKHITKANASDELSDTTKYAQLESNLSFVGYICIMDPVRSEVEGAIQDCRTAGINVIMITGDAKETAVAIARKLNIISPSQSIESCCFTGAEFEKMNEQKRLSILDGHNGKVFCRVEPRHKRELVKVLISKGEIVAMTGDGVNDAPALKQAHIGIAMGITGTEVAKQASDMILTDDNFATIVKAVEEGRSIYSNMKAFIRYLISSNIGEVASIFFTAAIGIPEGFNSVQLLWVNLVTDGFPATALGFNPPDKDVMTQTPRKSDDNLISTWTFIRYMIIGIYVGFATVGIFVYWYTMAETGDGHTLVTFHQLSTWTECPNWEGFEVNNFVEGMDFSKSPCEYFIKGKLKASTLSLSVLVMIEMFNAFNAISLNESLLTMTPFVNWYLIAATAGSTLLHCMIVYVPFFNTVFSIHSMNVEEWKLVMMFSLPVIVIEEVLKFGGRIYNARELEARLKKD